MANLSDFLSKGQDVVGAAEGLRSALPEGVFPPALGQALDKLTGKSVGGPGQSIKSSLNDFRSNMIYSRSIMRNNRFIVQILPPWSMIGKKSEMTAAPMIPFACDSANLPGVSLMSSDVRRHGVGPMEKKPYSTVFVDVTFNFIVDGTGMIHKFFQEWMNSIVKFDTPITDQTSIYMLPYEVQYKTEYCVDIDIYVYNESSQQIMKVKLYDAWPIFLGDVNLNWQSTDDFVKLPVTFAYTGWASETIDIPSTKNTKPESSGLQKLLAAGAALQNLANIRKPTGVGDVLNIVNQTSSSINTLKSLR